MYFIKKIKQSTNEYFSYNYKFKRVFFENFFCLIFRHDMDAIDNELFYKFIHKEKDYESGSSLFFRINQFEMFGRMIEMIDRKKYEIGLHSEAKPFLLPSRPEFAKLIELMYRRKIKKQVSKAKFLTNIEIAGHSPHAFHNYLPFKAAMNWMIIERSTMSVTRYLSDWKIPSYTPQGNEFPLSYEAPYKVESWNSSLIVFPTCWDDKFFLTPEEYEFQGIKKQDKNLEEGISSIKNHMANCHKKNQPIIINLHPYLWFKDDKYFQLKYQIIEYCQCAHIPILTFSEYLNKLSNT